MKKRIKELLRETFIIESNTPGISVTKNVQSQEAKFNKDAESETKKKFTDYDKAITGKGKDDIKPPKRNLSKDEEEIHNNVENSGGMNDLEFDGEINDRYKERQEMAIEGDSKMGNKTYTGKWNPETGEGNGNTEPVWGASNVDFGKNLIKQTKERKKVEDDIPALRQFGKIVTPAEGKTVGSKRKVAVENTKPKNKLVNEGLYEKGMTIIANYIKELGTRETAVKLIDTNIKKVTGMTSSDLPDDMVFANGLDEVEEFLTQNEFGLAWDSAKETASAMLEELGGGMDFFENKKQVKTQIKENTIKRLTFKKPFNGIEKALTLIPETYKVNDKEFIMTDGNETYKIRWEGSLNEGTAYILKGENKTLVKEDISKIKYLFNYNPKDNLTKGNTINENKEFNDIFIKIRAIEDAKWLKENE